MNVAFLGLGRMGAAMARHVLDAGHDLTVWNRSPGKADDLVSAGAREASSPAEAAKDADVVVTMLFGPDSVREVLLGDDGVVAGAREGTLVLESTTVGQQTARELSEALGSRGIHFVDAPVAGTVGPAKEGTLGVLVGASDEDYAKAEPLLHLWGDPAKVKHLGPVGTGSAMKLVVNLTLGVAMAGVGEALRLSRDLGCDREATLDLLEIGPFGFSTKQKRDMLESGEFSPTAFSLDLLMKDLDLCVSASHGELALTRAALDKAREAVGAGHGPEDYAALGGYVADEGHANSY